MFYDFTNFDPKDAYKLMISTITPRPIAWIVSQNTEGRINAAPFSFFNAFAGDPPIVGIGFGSHRPGRPKDTRLNIEQTGQFVINLVSEKNAEAMNITAIDFDYGVNELECAGVKTVPSQKVKPPRIADSPVSFECELFQIVELGTASSLVLGRIVAMHIGDEFILDRDHHYVDTPALKLIGRMHGAGWYTNTSDLFKMDRIPVQDWYRDHPQ
jgi:flavin reductase (DIM6/NTAB) family NADH-FMN oxidoreductase RutF